MELLRQLLTDWDDRDNRSGDTREVQNIAKANLLCRVPIRRKEVDVQVNPFELAAIENSHNRESERGFYLSFPRARPTNLEREPVAKIDLGYSIECVL